MLFGYSIIINNGNIMTFEEELNKRFNDQVKAVESMESNGAEIFNHTLNYQQRLTVQTLKERDFFLNYSDTGAGKTKAAISASYYLNAKHVLIFCPNSVKETWQRQINEANFVDEKNVVIDSIISVFDDNDFTFEIFNYDKFNSDGRAVSRIKALLNSKRYDLIVFDEVHRLKNKESETYKQIIKFVHTLKKLNPQIKFIGATATPITTSNSDLQSIYELLSGKQADELTMGTLASRLINANKILETCGFGYFPKSKMSVRYNGIDSEVIFNPKSDGNEIFNTELAQIDGSSIEEKCILHKGNVSMIEKLHMDLKFNAYKNLIRKGTVIYTEYTFGDSILYELQKRIKDSLNLSACIYSGEIKETGDGCNSINEFVSGNIDVLIGTKSMCEGVDGLQKISNRVILHTIPSVWSVMHQLIGRFDRQGSNFMEDGVDVFVPMVVFYLEDGKTTSFDKRRWKIAMLRKKKDDITKGGHLEEITIIEKQKMIDEVVSKLKAKHEMSEISRKDIEVGEIDFNTPEWQKRLSFISEFNRRGKTTTSKCFHEEITQNKEEWFKYHRERHESMMTWNEIPYEYIASKIKNKNRVVADFGCGENLMKKCIPNNKVYSFDHVAIDDSVIVCDMAHTPLEDESIDIAVFSLALWGTNFEDYFKEAYRILNYDGLVYIAEPTKSYSEEERNTLVSQVKSNGFTQVGDIECRGKFFYLTLIKK